MSAICLPPFCWRLLSLAYVPTRPPEVTFGAVNALPALRVALTQANFLELRKSEVRRTRERPHRAVPIGPGPPARSALTTHPRPSVAAYTVPEQRVLGHRDGAMRVMSYPRELRLYGVLGSSEEPGP